MNRIFTTAWSESRQQWVVTSELASGAGRPKLTSKKSVLALLLGAMLLPSGPVMAEDYVGTVVGGSIQVIDSGDTATSTTINNNGEQVILNGGSATDTTINSGGLESVFDGGSATLTTINRDGTQLITSGGSATDTTINSGGYQDIHGGTASNTTINYGGTQHVSGGGTATNTTIDSNGTQNVLSGGSATSTAITVVVISMSTVAARLFLLPSTEGAGSSSPMVAPLLVPPSVVQPVLQPVVMLLIPAGSLSSMAVVPSLLLSTVLVNSLSTVAALPL